MIKANQKLSFSVSLVPSFLADGALRRSLECSGQRATGASGWFLGNEIGLGFARAEGERGVVWER